jgi:hypothetical protein
MNRNFVRPLAACVLLAATTAAPASAVVTKSWNGWKWAREGNLALTAGDNVSARWKPFLATASTAWSADPVIDIAIAAGRTTASSCSPVYGTIQVCSGSYGFNGWLGYSNVWLQGGNIVMGTIRLNDSYFAAAKYNNDAWRQATICHEFGHNLGLDHADAVRTNANLGSCLDTTNDVTGVISNGPLANTAPGAGDFAGLGVIYAVPAGTQLASTRPTAVAGAGLFVEGWEGSTEDSWVSLSNVPEPSTWAMLVAGFGLTGAAMRRRSRAKLAVA